MSQANIDRIIEMFKTCPVCQNPLEIPPISALPACFLHGNVVVREDEIVFKLVRDIHFWSNLV